MLKKLTGFDGITTKNRLYTKYNGIRLCFKFAHSDAVFHGWYDEIDLLTTDNDKYVTTFDLSETLGGAVNEDGMNCVRKIGEPWIRITDFSKLHKQIRETLSFLYGDVSVNDDLVHSIVETFEEFLIKRNITIPTSEKEKEENGEPVENDAVIYGMDYGELFDNVAYLLKEGN